MRKFFLVACWVAASAVVHGQATTPAADPQNPTFRTGVDVIAVDVSVTDGRGRPVEDLLAPDFAVRIDGVPRRVVSAELVKIDVDAARRQAADPSDPVFTTNQTPPNGRMIVLAVDQLHIRTGMARSLMAAAGRFVDGLTPADRVAFVAFPQPGIVVDFTNDHLRLKNAMAKVIGQADRDFQHHNIGVREAIDIAVKSDPRILYEVVQRECRGLRGLEVDECQREIVDQATQMSDKLRQDRDASLESLRDILIDLVRIEGPKTLVVMSEGLILEGQSDLNEVVRLAGLGRVSVNVLLMDVWDADPSIDLRSPTAREDRQLEVTGLGDLAGATRGELFHVVGSGDTIFDRIASQTSAFYLVGVEQAQTDRDGKRHRIDVEVRRRDVTLHSRNAFVLSAASDPKLAPAAAVADALRSPFAVAELPMRASTFVTQNESSDKVRLIIASEVGVPGSPATDYTMGYAIFDMEGKPVVAYSEKKKLMPADGRANAPLEYFAAALVDPGNYIVRLAAVDPDGRRGSVIREVSAWQMSGQEFAFGDMFIGNLPDPDSALVKPGVEPNIDSGAIVAFLELYSTTPATTFAKTDVTFEIAVDQDAPAVASTKAELRGDAGNRRMAQGAIDAAVLPPGRYVARAKIASNGNPAGVLIRPFILGSLKPGTIVTATSPLTFGEIGKFDRSAITSPATLKGLLDSLETRGPALKEALTDARAGRYGAAALEALTAGDQPAAQFLRGLDFYLKGQLDQAANQFNIAAGPRREFFPAGLLLGAAYAEAGRDRDAAGVWQLALGTEPRPSFAYTLFADARLRSGQADAVITVLKPVHERTPADDQISRRLGLAYLITEQYADAVPILDTYLSRNATDQDILFAAIVSRYELHTRQKTQPGDAERVLLRRYAAAYNGAQVPLVSRYLQSLGVTN